jgi:hypothetical protein
MFPFFYAVDTGGINATAVTIVRRDSISHPEYAGRGQPEFIRLVWDPP